MEEIDFSELFRLFWKRKVPILIIIIISIIIGGIYTFKFVTPKYSSSITMVLVSNNSEEGTNSTITSTDIAVNSKLISTYSNLIKSKTVIKEVIENINNKNLDEEYLKKAITVNAIANTELIQVTVTDENSQLACEIANQIAVVFPAKVKEMYNIDNIQIMSEAEPSTTPSNINHKKDLMLFAILGVAVSVVYVIAISMLDNTIKGQETIEKEFNLPVLTTIPVWEKGKNRKKEEN